MSNLLLEGNVDTNAETIRTLREENEQLRQEVRKLRIEKASMGAAMAYLRKQLDPWQRALAAIYGEIDLVTEDTPQSLTSTCQSNAKWDFWKKRYPGRVADVIDLLLIQGEMNASQLCSALKCDSRTLSAKVIYPLNKAGLINKNGSGRYSLKEL